MKCLPEFKDFKYFLKQVHKTILFLKNTVPMATRFVVVAQQIPRHTTTAVVAIPPLCQRQSSNDNQSQGMPWFRHHCQKILLSFYMNIIDVIQSLYSQLSPHLSAAGAVFRRSRPATTRHRRAHPTRPPLRPVPPYHNRRFRLTSFFIPLQLPPIILCFVLFLKPYPLSKNILLNTSFYTLLSLSIFTFNVFNDTLDILTPSSLRSQRIYTIIRVLTFCNVMRQVNIENTQVHLTKSCRLESFTPRAYVLSSLVLKSIHLATSHSRTLNKCKVAPSTRSGRRRNEAEGGRVRTKCQPARPVTGQ